MITTNILKLNGVLENFNLSDSLNEKLHRDFEGFFYKEWSDFLKSYGLEPTIFNLNCLELVKGVILTDSQVKNLRELKGGLK